MNHYITKIQSADRISCTGRKTPSKRFPGGQGVRPRMGSDPIPVHHFTTGILPVNKTNEKGHPVKRNAPNDSSLLITVP